MEPQTPLPPKKGLGPLAWILIGCGGLVVLGTLVAVAGGVFVFNKVKDVAEEIKEDPVRAGAETFIRLNPHLELVSTDEATETMTVRDTRTGEEGTFDWSELREGRLHWETSDGESVTLDARGGAGGAVVTTTGPDGEETAAIGGSAEWPEWLRRYPGASDLTGVFSGTADGVRNRMLTFTTRDSVDEVLAWFEASFGDLDLEISKSQYSREGVEGASITGNSADGARSVSIGIRATADGTDVDLTSTERL